MANLHRRLPLRLIFIGLMLLIAANSLVVAEPQLPGRIAGTVVDEKSKPLAGLTLNLVATEPTTAPRTSTRPSLDHAPIAHLAVMLTERTVAGVVTDAKGAFVFQDIAPGNYLLKGGSKELGFIYLDVTVKSAETVDLGTITAVKL